MYILREREKEKRHILTRTVCAEKNYTQNTKASKRKHETKREKAGYITHN